MSNDPNSSDPNLAAQLAAQAAWAARRAKREAQKANRLALIQMAQQQNNSDPETQKKLQQLIEAETRQVELQNKWGWTGCAPLLVFGGLLLIGLGVLVH